MIDDDDGARCGVEAAGNGKALVSDEDWLFSFENERERKREKDNETALERDRCPAASVQVRHLVAQSLLSSQ